jgi:hypothetical protein
MAARMESTGERSRIHLSQTTAELLMQSGKSSWIVKRLDAVQAKGKGEVQTFWAMLHSNKSSGGHSSQGDEEKSPTEKEIAADTVSGDFATKKQERLIEWHVDLLVQFLKQIVATRMGDSSSSFTAPATDPEALVEGGVLDEVAEVIVLPRFEKSGPEAVDPDTVNLDPEVVAQLKDFIGCIASMYRSNPFHNFEHASHVTLSATKFLSRIVAPEEVDLADAADVHNYTYGITSDPLTQFAVVLSALIHDVEHSGLPNNQLAKENPEMASMYQNKSIAEQYSVDVAWNLLMDPCYKNLQRCIFSNQCELKRFRQLIVNSVMATDIFDPDMKKLRDSRWKKAFSQNPAEDETDLKATIVIEHIIQAADVGVSVWHGFMACSAN